MWPKIKTFGKEGVSLLWAAIQEYLAHKGARLAAALSFYSVFSLAPLLVVAVAVVGVVFGDEAARGEVFYELQELIGPKLASYVQEMVGQASYGGSGVLATVIGLATLLYGSSRIFLALRDALDLIWQVAPREDQGFKGIVKDYALSVALVPLFGIMFLAMVVSSTLISALNDWIETYLNTPPIIWRLADIGLSFVFLTLMFGVLFKLLPNLRLKLREVAGGAAVTAALFVVSKSLIGLYLGQTTTTSVFGAAGTLAVLLLWFYLSAQIFFFGATLTHVWAVRYGSRSEEHEGEVLTQNQEEQ